MNPHKIQDVEVTPVQVPLGQEFQGSHYVMTHRCAIITKVVTEDGLVGEIYNGDDMANLADIVRLIRRILAPLVIGRDIFEVSVLWHAMMETSTSDILSDRRIGLQAVACVESAIFDAMGKAVGLPLHRLWGARHQRLPVMVIGGYYPPGRTGKTDERAIGAEIDQYRSLDINACKFKVGGRSPEIDAERVSIARQAAGDEFQIAVDANQGWTREEALRFVELTQALNILWFEEPCKWTYDKAAMRDLRMKTNIPITAGQSELSAAGCIELMTSGAIDICNFDASWSGGSHAWLRVARAAEALGLRMAHHEEAQISAQLLGSVATSTFVEVFLPERDPIFYGLIANRHRFEQGYYAIPQGPGWGVEVDHDFVARYRLD